MRIDFTPKFKLTLDFTPRVYLKDKTHSYLLIREGRAYGYFLTMESGSIEVAKISWLEERNCYCIAKRNEGEVLDKEQRILYWDLVPYNYDFEKALKLYVTSTLEKSEKAQREIRVLAGTYTKVGVVTPQPRGKKPILGTYGLAELCTEVGMEPGLARRILRDRMEKPGGKWEWISSEAATPARAILLEAKPK